MVVITFNIKLLRTLRSLKLKNLLPNKIKLTIYNSLFKSHIEYGIVAWGNSADPGIKRICSLQKRSVRYISNARSKQHTSNLFAEHKILKFHDLVKHCELSFMYKYVYSILPSSFNDMLIKLNSFDRSLSWLPYPPLTDQSLVDHMQHTDVLPPKPPSPDCPRLTWQYEGHRPLTSVEDSNPL